MILNWIALFIISLSVLGVETPLEVNVKKDKFSFFDFSSSKSPVKKSQKKDVPEAISQKPVRPSETSQKEPPEAIPAFDKNNPLAKGIILVFHRWPNEQEEVLLLKRLTKAGL